MNRKKRSIILFILIFSLALGFAGCISRPKAAKTGDGRPIFRLGFAAEPSSLNPYAADNTEAAFVLSLIYDTLFALDPATGDYLPALCEDYSVSATSDGGVLWKMTLRGDVFWSDGEALTSRDVEFSLQSARDFSTLYAYPECEYIHTTGIAVEDETHISFVVWEDNNAVLECLSHVPILPKHIWNKPESMSYATAGFPQNPVKAREELYAMPANADTMIGSGLYIWGGMRENVCTLYRNSDYWGGMTEAEVVELHFGLDDPGEALKNEEIDACYTLSGANFAQYSEEGGVSLTGAVTDEMYYLGFNVRRNAGNALISDKAVRKAIALCLDRESIMNSAFGGGIAQGSFLSPNSAFHYDTEDTYDPSAAAELLENALYRDKNGDGVRENPSGEPLSLDLLCSDASPAWERAAKLVKASCAEAGIALRIETLKPETLLARVEAGDYALWLGSWKTLRDPNFSLNLFYWNGGDNALAYENEFGEMIYPGWNESGFDNANYDLLYEQMKAEKNVGRRQKLIEEMGELLSEEVPAAALGFAERKQLCAPTWLPAPDIPFTPYTIRAALQQIRLL